ncbi:MAG: hypothetical protein ABIH86_02385 [Planctomycetota bacterium]
MGSFTEKILSLLNARRRVVSLLVIAALALPLSAVLGSRCARQRQAVELDAGFATGSSETGSTPMEVAGRMLGGLKGMMVNVLWMMTMDAERAGRLNEVSGYYDMITRLQPRFTNAWESWVHSTRGLSTSAPNPQMRWFWLRQSIDICRRGQRTTGRSAKLYDMEAFIYRADFAQRRPNSEPLRKLLFDDDAPDAPKRLLDEQGVSYTIDTLVPLLAMDRINHIVAGPEFPDRRSKSDRLTFYYSARGHERESRVAYEYYRPSRRASKTPDADRRPAGWLDYEPIIALPAGSLGFFNAPDGEPVQLLRSIDDYDYFLADPKNRIPQTAAVRAEQRLKALHGMYLERQWSAMDAGFGLTLDIASAVSANAVESNAMARASDFYFKRSAERGTLVYGTQPTTAESSGSTRGVFYRRYLDCLTSERPDFLTDEPTVINALIDRYVRLKMDELEMERLWGADSDVQLEDLNYRALILNEATADAGL